LSSQQSIFTDFKRRYFSRNNFFFNYAANVFELAVESALMLIITVGLNALLLYLIKMFWYTYRATQVGLTFIKKFGNKHSDLVDIINQDIVNLSSELALSAFIFCLLIGSVSQFLYLGRFFQGAGSWLRKFMYGGLPLTFIVSAYFYRWPLYPVEHWSAAYILYFLPTLCIYALCFKICDKLLPEFGAAINSVIKSIRFIIRYTNSSTASKPIPPGK